MNLVWKLLRQHISISQFAGFAFANLFGMLIVLFGFQFYQDVLPVFTQQDSFMKADYLIMSKKIGMGNTISGRTNSFAGSEIDEISSQKFVKKIGKFTSTEYKVDASMGVNGVNVLNSELFFESVPDGFVDVPLKDWKYEPGAHEVPIILPRTYINMYNFGNHGYEVETDKLDAEKTTYFLRMIVMMVMVIGLVISALSFYILMLSIYLLVQKNSSKLENLLLIGYSPAQVSKPYQILTMGLNVAVLIIAWVALFFIRNYYMDFIEALYPDMEDGSMLPAFGLGSVLFLIVSLLNIVAIRRKVGNIWKRKE